MPLFRRTALQCLLLLSLTLFANPYDSYLPEDWVSFGRFRFAVCGASGTREAYIGTQDGVLVFDFWKKEWSDPLTLADGLPHLGIQRIWVDRDRARAWFKTRNDIFYYDISGRRWVTDSWGHPFDTLKIAKMDLDIRNLNVPYPYFFDGKTLKDASFNPYPVTFLFPADPDHFLLGTRGLGVAYGNARMKQAEIHPIGLWEKNVSCILYDGTDLWFGGGPSGGITVYHPRNNRWEYFHAPDISALPSNHLHSLVYANKTVYMATERGITAFGKKKNEWNTAALQNLSGQAVLSLCVSRDSSALWIGTESGLGRLRLSDGFFSWHLNNSERTYEILSLAEDPVGLWVGTAHGLFRCVWKDADPLNPKSAKTLFWEKAPRHRLIEACPIHSLLVDRQTLYIGLDNGLGSLRLDSLQFQEIPDAIRSANLPVLGIVKTDSSFWLGTPEGVLEYRPDHKAFVSYTTQDGLIHNQVNALAVQDDFIWLGTPQGVTRCNWKRVQKQRLF